MLMPPNRRVLPIGTWSGTASCHSFHQDTMALDVMALRMSSQAHREGFAKQGYASDPAIWTML